jgi:Ca2+/Na+ antiporter
MKNKCPSPTRALLLGLLIAQPIATLQVYFSDKALYQTLTAISKAGYLIIPNRQTMPRLLELSPAFFGGLFFTLSVGAGLSILAIATAWVWDQFFNRNRNLLLVCLILWLGLLLLVNWSGICLMTSLYFLFIPPAVFLVTSKRSPLQTVQRSLLRAIGYALPIPLLALVWSAEMANPMFTDLRDYLLLSNSLGVKINDFYYKYTLFPAEVIKPLDQKTLKTCYLGSLQNKSMVNSLERQFLLRDYLSLDENHGVDLNIRDGSHELIFEHYGKEVLQASLKTFVASPAGVLKEFSEKIDRFSFFRHFTFLSLLLGFPIILYIFLHALLCFMSSFLFDSKISTLIASGLCLSLGVALFLVVYTGREGKIPEQDLARALQSNDWQNRVAGLKAIERRNLEIGGFREYRRLLASPHLLERYWLARDLGRSRQPETYRPLVMMLNDPSPNVVSTALSSLGQRGDPKAINEILSWMETSDHWYCQLRAYRALRALGWKQSRSK